MKPINVGTRVLINNPNWKGIPGIVEEIDYDLVSMGKIFYVRHDDGSVPKLRGFDALWYYRIDLDIDESR